jgi:hypothetical protein
MTWPFAAGLDRAFHASQIALEHDPEEAKAGFFRKAALGLDPRDHAQTKLERDDDSQKSHLALAAPRSRVETVQQSGAPFRCRHIPG